jgi:hypothetical protein
MLCAPVKVTLANRPYLLRFQSCPSTMIAQCWPRARKNCTVKTIHDVHHEHEVYLKQHEGTQQGMSRRPQHLRLYAG